MRRSLSLSVFAALCMSAGVASAAEQHGHAHDHKPLYGGMVAENKFVAKGNFKSGVGVRVGIVVALAGKPETKLNFRLRQGTVSVRA